MHSATRILLFPRGRSAKSFACVRLLLRVPSTPKQVTVFIREIGTMVLLTFLASTITSLRSSMRGLSNDWFASENLVTLPCIACSRLPASGLRINEALAIRVGDDRIHTCLDSPAAIVHVRNGLYRGLEMDSPKTQSGIRGVDLHPKVIRMLEIFVASTNRKPGIFCLPREAVGR